MATLYKILILCVGVAPITYGRKVGYYSIGKEAGGETHR